MKLHELSRKCKGQLETGNPTSCMCHVSMHAFSKWELAHYPWWIDFTDSQVLKRGRDLFKKYDTSKKSMDKVIEKATTSMPQQKGNEKAKPWCHHRRRYRHKRMKKVVIQ